MKIRLLIADDHEIVREGLRATFENTRIEVVGEASTGTDAIKLAQQVAADVLLLDVRMPDGDGFEVLRNIHGNVSLAILLFSWNDQEVNVHRARALGAHGFLSKQTEPCQIVNAIEAVSRGETIWRDFDDRVPSVACDRVP